MTSLDARHVLPPAFNWDPASIGTSCLNPRPVSGTRRLCGTRLHTRSFTVIFEFIFFQIAVNNFSSCWWQKGLNLVAATFPHPFGVPDASIRPPSSDYWLFYNTTSIANRPKALVHASVNDLTLLVAWLRWQCDNYNLKSNRRCNNMSRMNLSGYVGHVTIFSWMFTIACCLVVWF